MGAILEFIAEGFKKFAGEIIGVLLLVIALKSFPCLRSLFTAAKNLKEDDTYNAASRTKKTAELSSNKKELRLREEALRKAEAQKINKAVRWDVYVCMVCGYEYYPEAGDSDNGVAPGTAWANVPEDWVCPMCGVDKGMFESQGYF